MESERIRSHWDDSLTYSRSVVEEIGVGELMCAKARRCYGTQGSSTVLVWLRNCSHGRRNAALRDDQDRLIARHARLRDPRIGVQRLYDPFASAMKASILQEYGMPSLFRPSSNLLKEGVGHVVPCGLEHAWGADITSPPASDQGSLYRIGTLKRGSSPARPRCSMTASQNGPGVFRPARQ